MLFEDDMVNDPRDETTSPYAEQYPLHADFQMPPPRASRPSFVSATIAQAVVAAHQQGNSAAFALALEWNRGRTYQPTWFPKECAAWLERLRLAEGDLFTYDEAVTAYRRTARLQ
jgi:hypothetical protein